MKATIIDGQKLANQLLQTTQLEVTRFKAPPQLAVILVGQDPASMTYISRKQQACEQTGIISPLFHLAEATTEQELLDLINKLNQDSATHGILVQLPLPSHIDKNKLIEAIDPKKDVDGFHPYNLGRLAGKNPTLRPCTPYGIMQILTSIDIKPRGKHAVVIGASNIVGRPMALELLLAESTVTICHQKTVDLAAQVAQADILVSATGVPNLIKGDWIKSGATVIDVGMGRLESGQLCGDIEFDLACQKAQFITPVPGGVGPMTVATLMQNTVLAYRLQLI